MPAPRNFPTSKKKSRIKHLSDLLDTHQHQPTEVRRRELVKIITTPWTRKADTGIEDIEVISKGGDSVALLKSLEVGRLL
ncbi:Nucleic acid-binding OB-fold [Penicillium malachiteum]|uniref:Nucleic acid-binding OB-fold n=1 Tax=Penicillium malachiteum TaxID=1324776 RepID=UPI0025495AC9|nr:Nucleic acid-binding OB-fold [Penicillium malachiteum]KAJ5714134.1 Nucleic acid-binding OB-fold [Penicillium malachiteum]